MGLFGRLTRRFLNAAHRPQGIMFSEAEDRKMAEAIESARETMPEFLKRLQTPLGNMDDFAIKVGMKTADDTLEHCWVSDLELKGEILKGKLSVQPNNVPGYRLGSPVEVNICDISDWAYSVDGTFKGHFTTKCLLKEMPKQMQRQVMEIYGWNLSDIS